MNLTEMNEAYDENALTEEYLLQEGLKFFKKSKKLYNYVDRVDKKLAKKETKSKISASEISKLKAMSKDLLRLADEYKVVEDNAAAGKTDKKVAKGKIKQLGQKNARLLALLKKDETKQIFKKIGFGAIAIGLTAALTQLGMMNPTIGKFLYSKTATAASTHSLIPDGADILKR